MTSSQGPAAPEAVVFRAGKKRKAFRQRIEDEDEPREQIPTSTTAPSPGCIPISDRSDVDRDGPTIKDALRLRNARRARGLGPGFRPDSASDASSASQAAMRSEDGREPPAMRAPEFGLAGRFVPQTEVAGELVNKHMEDYIEAELAKRASVLKNEVNQRTAASLSTTTDEHHAQQRTAMDGRLQEVDITSHQTSANGVAGRIQHSRRLNAKQPKLAPDGKPWRGRKRRGSDDVTRDKHVEDFLKANALDVYERPAQTQTPSNPGQDEGADERVAADFRREFMEAMSERNRKKKPFVPPPPSTAKSGPAGKQEDMLKGPKLGGSRNAREAVRNVLLLEQEKKQTSSTKW